MKGYWMKKCDLWKGKSIEKDDRNNCERMESYLGRKQRDLNKGMEIEYLKKQCLHSYLPHQYKDG